MNQDEKLELHQAVTLFEAKEISTDEEAIYLQFSRPQDWGNPNWKYFECVINVEKYIYHWHIWHQNDYSDISNCFFIRNSLFVFLVPGQPQELCDNSHLDLEDFWQEQWGEKPPIYDEEKEELTFLFPGESIIYHDPEEDNYYD